LLVLAKLLGVRPEDRRDTAVAFFTLVAILSAHSMLETARDALFLDKLPAERLPIAYLAIAVLALGVSRLNQAATARFARRKLLSLSLLVGGAITAGFHPVLASPATFSLEALYVWTGLLATVVVVQFWLQLGDVLDVVQAKRVFAIIGAGGLVGATLGSAGAGALLALFGDARSLLPVSGALFAVAAFVPIGFSTKSASEPARRRRGDSKRHRGLRILKGDAYLKRLFAMVLVAALLVTGVDYLFKAEVAAQAKLHGWDLGRFFALYYAIVNAVALLVQLLIAPRLLRAVGVNRALLVLPALMLFGAIGFTLTLGLIPALLLKGADGSMRHSIYKTSSEILYLPLSKTIRERFKAMAEALGQRGGQALASLIILAATAIDADARHVGWALVVLAGAWVASLFGLQPHYLERFKRQLRQGSLDTEIDVPELDLASFETLVAALSAADDAEVIAALGMFEAYGKTDLVPALILYHPSPQVVQHAFAMFAQTKRADVRRLTGRLLSHEDPEIRAEALRVSTHHEPNEEQLRGFLVDDSPVVRTGALVGLIRAGFADEQEATNKLRAILSGECRFSREALAKSIPELAESHTWVGIELAERGDTSLTAQVARAMAKAPHVDYLPVLMKMLASRDARANAREALLKLDHAALDHLEEQLANVDLPRNIRLHLPRTVSRFSDQRAAAILLDAL